MVKEYIITMTAANRVGILAAVKGGWIDMVIMRYIDLQWAMSR